MSSPAILVYFSRGPLYLTTCHVDIQEYLLLKGVEAVAIHGSKSTYSLMQTDSTSSHTHSSTLTAQEEREYAIKSFKTSKKDVMVASSIASKGLDFSEIQHVINFSMPKEIEVSIFLSTRVQLELTISPLSLQDYVHQIGRTGRSGKTGIATTFVNMQTPEPTLLDLKYLLMEAKQKFVKYPFILTARVLTCSQ